ncbi:MAG TPA: hypothetical protein VF543_18320 [Pyrinomonadaceae bacterium]|jgi:hypothetical protein
MKKILSLRNAVCLFTLMLGIALFSPQAASAQQTSQVVTAVPLYRFIVPDANQGYFLTPNYQEGINRGYYYNATVGGILIPPGPGWTPAPGQYVVPMHRWRVRHRAGTNYYYSADIYPSLTSNSENTYEGLMGYALHPTDPNFGFNRFALHLWYSQTNGYYYTPNGSLTVPPARPNSSYNWQGVAYILPNAPQTPFVTCGVREGCFTFLSPPAAPVCNADQEQACYNDGGMWNSDNCSCSYITPPGGGGDDPKQCQPGMICPETPYNPQ